MDELLFFSIIITPFISNIVHEWFDDEEIFVLSLPSENPDLNIIENLWSYFENELWEIRSKIHDQDELWDETVNIWYSEKTDTIIPRLYDSMASRVAQILKRRGNQTDY